MQVTNFERITGLLIVRALAPGPRREAVLSLAVDTGSVETVIVPAVCDELGYSPRDGEHATTVRAAIGEEHSYTLRVHRFFALGYTMLDYRVHVFDLAIGDDIVGLIGLSFLDQFNYEVRSTEGRLLVERAAAIAT